MYHCVPRMMSGLSQMSGFKAKWTITTTKTGNNRLAGNAARNCAKGWIFSARRGRSPTPTPIGTQIKEAAAIRTTTRVRVNSPSFRTSRTSSQPTPEATKAMIFQAAKTAIAATATNQTTSVIAELDSRTPEIPPRSGAKRCRARARSRRLPGLATVPSRRLRWSRSRNQDSGTVCAPGLLKAKFVGPGNQGAEHQLVIEEDHGDHRQDHPSDDGEVFLRRRPRQVGTDAGQGDRCVADRNRLARHDEEPAAGHAHHHVPDQTRHGERYCETPAA